MTEPQREVAVRIRDGTSANLAARLVAEEYGIEGWTLVSLLSFAVGYEAGLAATHEEAAEE